MLKIASGDQNLRAKETGAYELREVTRQFNAMLDQIDQLMAAIQAGRSNPAVRTSSLVEPD